MNGIIINYFMSWWEIVIDIYRDIDDVVRVRWEMFGRDAVASYFRWHMGILVLSTDVKLIVRTVGITSISSSLSFYSTTIIIFVYYIFVSNISKNFFKNDSLTK